MLAADALRLQGSRHAWRSERNVVAERAAPALARAWALTARPPALTAEAEILFAVRRLCFNHPDNSYSTPEMFKSAFTVWLFGVWFFAVVDEEGAAIGVVVGSHVVTFMGVSCRVASLRSGHRNPFVETGGSWPDFG